MAKKPRPQAVQYFLEVIDGEPRIFEITRYPTDDGLGWLFGCNCRSASVCKHLEHVMARAKGDPGNFLAEHVDVI